MKVLVICALLLVAVIAEIRAATVVDKKEATVTETKKNSTESFDVVMTGTTTEEPKVIRHARQLGYGGQYGNLASQLAGISSGYGYGYNNALGLGGLGAGGAGAGYLPLLG